MTCVRGLTWDTCPASPWCSCDANLPPSALPDPEQLDLFGEEDE